MPVLPPGQHAWRERIPHVIETDGLDLILTIGKDCAVRLDAREMTCETVALALRTLAEEVAPAKNTPIEEIRVALWDVQIEMLEAVDLAAIEGPHRLSSSYMTDAATHLGEVISSL